MAKKQKLPRSFDGEKSQIDRFFEVAGALETDRDEKRLEEALRRIGRAKPPDKDETKDDDQKPGQ